MDVNPVVVLAQTAEGASKTDLHWWQVATGMIGVPTALIGLLVAYRVSNKTRLESRKLQLEILEKEGKSEELGPRSLLESPRARAAGLQDLVLRFIVLYLAFQGWNLIERLISPLLGSALSVWINTQDLVTPPWVEILGVTLVSQLTGLGDLVIFVVLGFPLLKDIAASQGVGMRDVLRRPQPIKRRRSEKR